MAEQNTKKNLPQLKADEIYEMIFLQKIFKPGEKLPNENTFSQMLGVSRSTLREAIRILVQQGILHVRHGSGTYVTSDPKFFNDYGIGKLSSMRVRLKDLYEMRLLFEPQITSIACRRATKDELRNICIKGEKAAEAIRCNKDRTEYDQEFHRAIIMASHNEFMIQLIPLIETAVSESITMAISDTNAGKTLAYDTLHDHALIMEFLQNRDERAAKHAMEIHIHHAINTLKLHLKDEVFF